MSSDEPASLDRRDFLRAGGLAAAAGLLSLDGANAAGGDRQVPRRVEAAIATICCDGFGDENFVPAFEAIPKLGLRNVEFNCWYARNLTPAGLADIKERCQRTGLVPISIQASSFAGGNNHDIAREVSRLLWLIEACDVLGCRIIKCTGANRGTSGGLNSIITVLKELVPVAERRGVSIVLENHFNNNLEFPEDYDRVFQAIESPRIGMCLDMGHFAASKVDMDALIDRFHTRILHVDVKDCAEAGKSKFCRFGEGIVDVEGVIGRCLKHDYRGCLVIELSLIDKATMLDDLRKGVEIVRKFEA